MLLDLADNLLCGLGMPPIAAVTNDTAFVSEIHDCANETGVTFVGIHGTNADTNTTYTVLVEDGDVSNLSDNVAVADEYLTGVEAIGLDFADDNKVFKIGYTGMKRYVRVTITPANNTGNVFLAGVWISTRKKLPTSTQVV